MIFWWILGGVVVAILAATAIVVSSRGKELPPAPTRPELSAPESVVEPDERAERRTPTPSADPGVDREQPRGLETPESTLTRFARLRRRLASSQNALARGLADLLSVDRVDDRTWDDFETTLISSDLGVGPTTELVSALRRRLAIDGVADAAKAKAVLREEMIGLVDPSLDRTLHVTGSGDDPGVVMVVGVNGTGKTTTVGKLARVLVAEGRTVLLGAADTFRAAAADQLQTWGERVGVQTVRGAEGADPASVAYAAVKDGIDSDVGTVIIDTAGRLHTKTGLMDQLGKVKRVIEKLAPVTEVLLVLDATTGQNGLAQARIFAEVVDVTGIVLTKLDGSAKGGIVVQVQRELGVPVKLIGLGEGVDDLAPFDPEQFVDGLLGD